jgi:hypothetical protein
MRYVIRIGIVFSLINSIGEKLKKDTDYILKMILLLTVSKESIAYPGFMPLQFIG